MNDLCVRGALKARNSTAQGEGAREACDGTLGYTAARFQRTSDTWVVHVQQEGKVTFSCVTGCATKAHDGLLRKQ